MEPNLEHRSSPKPRPLERSLSYSEAIGNDSRRSSIQIPSIMNTDVYTNEELKKHYRISQTYVEGKEISFPAVSTNVDTIDLKYIPSSGDGLATDTSQYSSEDEATDQGLTMSIDIECTSYPSSPRTDAKPFSETSTALVCSSIPTDIYDRIDAADSLYDERDGGPSAHGYSTPYSRRKKKSGRHRQRHGRKVRSRRVVQKGGEENVPIRSNIPAKSLKYMRDYVNTVINSKWRFLILLILISHFTFWLLFATIWYVVAQSYAEDIGDGRQHCVNGTSSFAGLLMMSVETQMTIGYGIRFPNEECPEAIIVMVIEIVAGTAMSGGLSSLLFTKLIRPNKQVSSVGFSKKATVCLRDGELVLQFRVWDLLHVHFVSSTITAYILKPIRVIGAVAVPLRSLRVKSLSGTATVIDRRVVYQQAHDLFVSTLEGEMVQNYIHQLKLKQANAFLLWPITVVHVIDAESPLYDFSAQDMMDYRFEIVVTLNGSSKNMGTVTQSRTSYLSKEIIWGYRFKNVLRYSKKKESYVINTERLNSVEQVETPLCSASRLKEFEDDIKVSRNFLSSPNLSMTNMSYSQEDSATLTNVGGSVASSASLNRTGGIQTSFGWKFRKFQPEKYVGQITE